MQRAIVGTAGHIDHGKTRLIEALTGIDCDRWQEEKERGITIDLGFAHLENDDLQVGFIDVPGHERFLHNALAGLGGIRIMLLVVASDEGVKPQTREHLDICSLLEIPHGIVALTKTDLVDDDLVELAELEVSELLETTPFAGSPIIPVSAVTGNGIDGLRGTILALAGDDPVPEDVDRPTRLPVDRSFHLKGLGVIVTGTLASGAIAPGDTLELVPARRTVRVRSVQVHGAPRDRAFAGERTSLQLTGVELDELARGQQLITPKSVDTTHRILARYRHLDDTGLVLSGWTPARLHLFSAATVGKVRPLDPPELGPEAEGIVELRLDGAVPATRGDRFVLRRPSPASTLGGGIVLDPQWRRRRPVDRAPALAALGESDDGAIRLWVAEAAEGGVTAPDLARRLGCRTETVVPILERLASDGRLVTARVGSGGRRWVDPGVFRRVSARAERVLSEYFERDRLASGMPKAEAVRRMLRGRGRQLADVYFPWLEAQGILAVTDSLVGLPGRSVSLTGEESGLAARLTERFEAAGLTPPSPAEICRELGGKPQICDGVITYLVRQNRLVKLPNGLLVSCRAVDELIASLGTSGWERFTVAMFKERYGLSRKWTIPLLEYLDSSGVTRRAGDERLLIR